MQAWDWLSLAGALLVVLAVGIYANRYVKSVATFISSGRLADRYLLAVSRGEMQAGAVVFVAAFERFSRSGFNLTWWGWINNPIFLLVGISGFVIYRYRETRAMTLAQFFEIRYSKSFRLFTGALGFIAGIANFGIIPAIGAQFFVHFLGFPETLSIFSHTIPTYIPVMAVFLTANVVITIAGGIITLMITDCLEGIISQLFFLAIIAALLSTFSWSQIVDTLGHRAAGQSLLNPFDSLQVKDFNLGFTLMYMFGALYGTMAWQHQSGFNSASATPHESRMSGILSAWREAGKFAVIALLAGCAMTFMKHPDFAAQSSSAHATLALVKDAHTQAQMEIPIALTHLLPTGLRGMFAAILLMGLLGGDSVHLHSWGSIFVQDVLLLRRKRPVSPGRHIFLLRLSMAGVALFAFLFGCFFRQTEYIIMWWSVTASIFVGGAGAAIIGGLYWRKGTTAGAWFALIIGSTLSVGGILARQYYGSDFVFNGQEIAFYSSLTALISYVLVSLLTHKEDFNMDRMLHRGQYAVSQTPGTALPSNSSQPRAWPWRKLIGIDQNFTHGDRWITIGLFLWNMLWFVAFLVGSIWNLLAPWPESAWAAFWRIAAVVLPITICVVTSVWFTWGGLRDIFSLFRKLRLAKVNHADDGTVVGHRNLADLMPADHAEQGRFESQREPGMTERNETGFSPKAMKVGDRSIPRLALVGVSGYAKHHLDFLLSAHHAGRLVLQAVVATNPAEEIDQCHQLASTSCPVYPDFEELLRVHRGRIDLCVIPTPIHHHLPMTTAALLAGANVLVEKPLTAEAGAIQEVRRLERESGRFVAVAFQDIYAEGTLALKQMLVGGKLGRLVSFKACGLWPRHDTYYQRNDWAGRLHVGSVKVLDSPLNNAFAHQLNLMLFLAGSRLHESATVTEVQAELFRARTIESFDTAAVRVQTSHGARLLMLASHSSREVWSPEIVMECTAGLARWTLGGGLEIFDQAGRLVAGFAPRSNAQAMEHMYGGVLRRLHNRDEFICSTEIAAKHVDCITRIHQSATIRNLVRSELVSLEFKDEPHMAIRNLEEYFREAFSRGLLLSEVGCPWAKATIAAGRSL